MSVADRLIAGVEDRWPDASQVPGDALAAAQAGGDVLAGLHVLLDAYKTDVRPLCAKMRAELGAAEDPIAALRASGYVERVAAERDADALATRRSPR